VAVVTNGEEWEFHGSLPLLGAKLTMSDHVTLDLLSF
jgi:hypothetical protein